MGLEEGLGFAYLRPLPFRLAFSLRFLARTYGMK